MALLIFSNALFMCGILLEIDREIMYLSTITAEYHKSINIEEIKGKDSTYLFHFDNY